MGLYRKVEIFINHESHKSDYPEYVRSVHDKITLLKRGQIIKADHQMIHKWKISAYIP